MRSNAQRRPPPGYERRTQEYFENLDEIVKPYQEPTTHHDK